MKTREYEFEGARYRWVPNVDGTCRHQAYMYGSASWVHATIPPTPAAVSALAALIEDMQVRVIAEWADETHQWQARQSDDGTTTAWWFSLTDDEWYADDEGTAAFAAGYEAGKAAR